MKQYQMTQEQYNTILEASKPVPYMVFNGIPPHNDAKAAWQRLGKELGFKWDTARPIEGKDHTWFEAEEIE